MDLPVPALPLANLPVPPHRLEDLFWERVLPVLVVLAAASASAAVGKAVALRAESLDLGVPTPQAFRRVLRGALQAVVFIGLLAAAVLVDRSLHGDPRGLDMTERFGTVVALLWAGFLSLDAVARHLSARFHRLGRISAATVVPMLDKVAQAAWALLVVTLFLENLGLDIKALLAGLGVGGLAIALAGQKTVENLFGGLVLVLDQPVRVGDFCRFGDKMGVVEHVGMRSIKLRTPDRTLIAVPNGEFSQLVLENFARRDKIMFNTTLHLRADTRPAVLKRVLIATEALLKADTGVDVTQSRRVRLEKVGAWSLDLDVFCYADTADWERYMSWRQELLFKLLEAVEREGARLAYPTQTVLGEAPDPPPDRAPAKPKKRA